MENQLNILIDIAIACLLGGLLGLEREWKSKPAGLRTNMIIAGASALFVSLGRVVMLDFSWLSNPTALGMDPIRILHAVIVGVGFIGAGTILKSTNKNRVHFLTTSATIWMSSALGMTVALKQYVLALGCTLLILAVNYILSYVEAKLGSRHSSGDD